MEGPRCWRNVKRDPSGPSLEFETILVNVVESFQSKVDSTEDIHGFLSGTRCMSISTFDIAMHLAWL